MRVSILTVSDSAASGTRADRSGPAVAERCRERDWQLLSTEIVSDDRQALEKRLSELADSGSVDLVLTTGGTRLGPRDTTPEATAAVCSRLVPGLGERMRARGRLSSADADLSRAIAGLRAHTLIVNLPGSLRGAIESLEAVADLLPHALDVMGGAGHE